MEYKLYPSHDIAQHLKFSPLTKVHPDPRQINLNYSLDHCKIPGQILEFGVSIGESIRLIADKRPNDTVYGFDSFVGTDEQWLTLPPGTYSTYGKLPEVPANVELIAGFFQDTLPNFKKDTVAFMHIDSETYSAAKCVLDNFENYIVKGTIIVFDEFWFYPGVEVHEYRAFQEYIDRTQRDYRVLSYTPNCAQLSVVML